MKRKLWNLYLMAAFFVLTLPATVLAAGGGGASYVVIVSDTRKLSGILAWWGNLYNESHFYFTLLTVVLIPVVGVIFGVIADIVMSMIGIDLKSRELAEH